MTQAVHTGGFLIRPAAEADLGAIVEFEIEIARVSFGDDAIEDPGLHRKRVAAALGKPGELTLVAVAADAPAAADVPAAAATPAELLGWAWLSGRTNSLTGARYGNFRSLATADVADRAQIAELLMQAVLAAAAEAGYGHLTGKVHAQNLGMRTLYRKFGFEATHITMEWRSGPGGWREGLGESTGWREGPGESTGWREGPGESMEWRAGSGGDEQ